MSSGMDEELIHQLAHEKGITPDQARSIHLLRTDYPTFAKTFLRIKDKNGDVVPFILNAAQQRLWRLIKKQMEAGVPIRIIILKARQLGMSTFIQGFLFWKALTDPGTNSLVVAHDEDASSELFTKQELMMRQLPEEYREELEDAKDTKKQGKKLAFAGELNTLIYVDTAGKATVGRSQTYQYVHLSEFAYYPKPREMMQGLSQSVPKSNSSVVIIESTANGMGNYFHSLWDKAVEGKNQWAPLFIAWFEDEGYRMDPPKDFRMTPAERKLKRKYQLDEDQIYWRRYVIENDFEGSVEDFEQENPAESTEAFLISGRPYFGKTNLHEYRRRTEDPLKEGNFEVIKGKPTFKEFEEGPWRIWKRPVPSRAYVIGADVAGGSARDFSAAHVIDLISLEVVASFRGKIDPHQFALQLKWAGLLYGTALLAVERNGEGRACVLKLVNDLLYPKMYYPVAEESWDAGQQEQWGFVTTSKTRPTILSQLNELLTEKELGLYCARTLRELESFVRVDSSKIAQAATGGYDDMVMSLAIACSSSVRDQAHKLKKKKKSKRRRFKISSITGY